MWYILFFVIGCSLRSFNFTQSSTWLGLDILVFVGLHHFLYKCTCLPGQPGCQQHLQGDPLVIHKTRFPDDTPKNLISQTPRARNVEFDRLLPLQEHFNTFLLSTWIANKFWQSEVGIGKEVDFSNGWFFAKVLSYHEKGLIIKSPALVVPIANGGDRQTDDKNTDIVTYRLNWPRGQFSENIFMYYNWTWAAWRVKSLQCTP